MPLPKLRDHLNDLPDEAIDKIADAVKNPLISEEAMACFAAITGYVRLAELFDDENATAGQLRDAWHDAHDATARVNEYVRRKLGIPG